VVPNYNFRIRTADGSSQAAQDLGLYNDEAALSYAKRIARSSEVEVWRQGRLVGSVPAHPSQHGMRVREPEQAC
jgi:hypothetical protein